MELPNNKVSENIEDVDFELVGKRIKLPDCATCKFSNGSMCMKYNMEKSKLQEKGIDIFDCPSYEPEQEPENIQKIKEMGFND